jgi:hypothetical protein
VGVYVGLTSIVDRTNTVAGITPAQKERSKAAIQTQFDNNGDITITYNLPANIYSTNSPVVRGQVFVRVGVKTVGVAELLYSPVAEVALGNPAS